MEVQNTCYLKLICLWSKWLTVMKIQAWGARGSTWEWKRVSLSSKIPTCPEKKRDTATGAPTLCWKLLETMGSADSTVSTHLGNTDHTTLQTGGCGCLLPWNSSDKNPVISEWLYKCPLSRRQRDTCAHVNSRSSKLRRATLWPLLLTQTTVQSLAHVAGFATSNWIQALRLLPFASKHNSDRRGHQQRMK